MLIQSLQLFILHFFPTMEKLKSLNQYPTTTEATTTTEIPTTTSDYTTPTTYPATTLPPTTTVPTTQAWDMAGGVGGSQVKF